jgi:hypothetical protein
MDALLLLWQQALLPVLTQLGHNLRKYDTAPRLKALNVET